MKIIQWDELPKLSRSPGEKFALTIGMFDGLHIGHRKLIEHTVANGVGLIPVVVTFLENPRLVFEGEKTRKDIVIPAKKAEILEGLGVKLVVMIDFSLKFSKISATDFFNTLARAFQIKKLVVGSDFSFGRDREAGSRTLKKMSEKIGAFLEVLDTVHYKGLRVSSTRIRHAICEGNFSDVRMMLLDDYRIWFQDSRIFRKQEGDLVVPLAGLRQVIPLPGTYRCRVHAQKGTTTENVYINRKTMKLSANKSPIDSISFLEKINE